MQYEVRWVEVEAFKDQRRTSNCKVLMLRRKLDLENQITFLKVADP